MDSNTAGGKKLSIAPRSFENLFNNFPGSIFSIVIGLA